MNLDSHKSLGQTLIGEADTIGRSDETQGITINGMTFSTVGIGPLNCVTIGGRDGAMRYQIPNWGR